jgi:hypothetical protein
MAAPTLKQVSLTPDLPRDPQVVDEKGMLTPIWKTFFEQWIQAMQTNLGPEGFKMPQQSASNIALLTTVSSLGNILYNSTNNTFMGNLETAPGVYTWKTFTLT